MKNSSLPSDWIFCSREQFASLPFDTESTPHKIIQSLGEQIVVARIKPIARTVKYFFTSPDESDTRMTLAAIP
jgi:hypothetical protein